MTCVSENSVRRTIRWKLKISLLFRTLLFCYIVVNNSLGKIFVDDTTSGYEGVVIGVADDGSYDEENAVQLINNIMELMRNSSDMLYSATHNQLYFKNITILVPYSWTNLRGIHVDHLATSEVFSNAPIRVRQMNPDQGDKPYTLQRGDCTEPGEFIHLTPGFLNSMNDLNTTTKYGDPVKKLIGEWIKLRFGVFSEEDSELFYYDPEQNEFSATYCANEVANGTLTNPETKTLCALGEMGMPLEYCRFELSPHDNPNLFSSLLFTTHLDSVTEFCNETTHNIYSPSLQNRRCKGKSVWEVMRQHSDFFKPPRDTVDKTTPKFQIVASQEFPNLILALDVEISENKSIMNSVLAAVSTYLLYAVPENTTVTIVTIDDDKEATCYSTPVSSFDQRRQLVMVVESVFKRQNLSDKCQPQQKTSSDWNNGIVVYITASNSVKGNWSKLNGAKFMPVFLNVSPNKNLTDLADQTDGKPYAFFGDELELEEDLDSALFDVSKFWNGDCIIQVVSSIMVSKEIPLNYVLDSDIAEEAKIIVSTPIDTVSGDQLILVSPNYIYEGNYTTNVSSHEKTFYTFNIDMKMPGLWSFRTNYHLSTNHKLVVKVIAVVNPLTNTVISDAHINRRDIWPHNGVFPEPIVTITFNKGSGFTVPTSAIATIYIPNSERESSTNSTKNLRDDGAGADVKKNDGVYSTSINKIVTNGVYRITTTIYGGNYIDCDSKVGKSFDCFQREPCPLYFEVHGYSKGTDDNILPGNITDLYGKVKFNQAWDTIVTLTWTAPGDVSKDGMIMGYDIQVFPSYENASSFDGGTVVTDHMIVSGSFTPSPAGENQSVTVKFHSKLFGYLETGYISVRAYDEYDNFGYGSNIVTIPLLSDGDSSPSTAQSTEWDSTNITEDSIPTSAVYAGDHAYDGIIASAVLLLLAVVCGLGIYAYQKVVHVKTKRRRKRYQPFIIGYPSDGTVV